MKIGSAKYGFTQKKYYKLKDGDVTFRILPPLGELADEGKWSVFYSVHYGYKNSAGKLRVFVSPEVVNRKTKMVEIADAANDRIKKLKAELEKAKEAGNKGLIEKLGKLVSGQKPMYNLDKNHYMNVVDLQGNIGVLKLRHKAKQALDQQIKRLRERGIDPLSVDNGRFFVFSRSGSGLETNFAVAVAQETLNVEGVGEVKRDIVHKLGPDIISRLKDEAAELDKLFKKPTSEEVARIVAESDLLTGNSKAVDEILDAKSSGGGSDDTGGEDEGDYDSDESDSSTQSASAGTTAAAAQTTTQAASSQSQPTTQASSVTAAAQTTTAAPVQAPVQQIKEETKAAPKVETVSSPTQTTAQQVSEMSDDEFLKSLGL